MQQPSLHSSRLSPCTPPILIKARGALSAVFLWWAVINTSIPLPDGGAYSSIHGPFQTAEKCLAFVRLFRSTYDDRASGAQVAGVFCVDPRKGKVVK
ncbi:MAG: hypothetical protein ACREJ4_12180 [Candidatus Methylomirabilaceae bacterium]